MASPAEFVDTRRPAGGRRSSKRDAIVAIFLRQSGHLSADEFVERVRDVNPRLSRATVYRTLQWMVDAGVAQRVDFGNGRFKYEGADRHPRHFHLICKQCHQSSEFLSSDVETLIEEVASTRGFSPTESMIQVYGLCQDCRAGRTPQARPVSTDAVFARDALRVAIATERSGLGFYTRAAKLSRDPRGRRVFERLAVEEQEHLATLERRYQQLIARDPSLESQPAFLFFKGAANGLFAAGTKALTRGGADRQALLVGIRCERGSHKFFKHYGERFEESEGRRIFLEFADEEKAHLELLIREYRALIARQARPKGSRPRTA
jgi:Fur family ferric uptake transcriptional regulator